MSAESLKKEIAFCVLMLGVGCACLVQSYAYDDTSSQFPRFLSTLLVLLGVANIFRVVRLRPTAAKAVSETSFRKDPWLGSTGRVLFAVALYVLCLKLIGYYVSTTLFLGISMYVFREKDSGADLRRVAPVAIAVFLAMVYGLFNVFLGTSMPEGCLF